MSRETTEWLNTYTLQSKRAWHTSDKLQQVMEMPTVYDGPIPVEDVHSRLFSWTPVEGTITARYTNITADGVTDVTIEASDRKAIMRLPGSLGPDDKGAVLYVPKSGYLIHPYGRWLVENVETILSDDLAIFSAGLLRGGAQGFVQVSVPDTITTPEGVEFRPNLLAATSLDGSLATTYKRTVTEVICDNTMSAGLSEKGQTYKIKHSRYSNLKIADARTALEVIFATADDFSAEVKTLCEITVTDKQWAAFLEEIAPLTTKGEAKTGRALTMAENRQNELKSLWNNDLRVAPWKNTAFGIVQAVNTHAHHIQTVRGSERDERNMSLAVTGGFDKLHAETVERVMALVK